MGQSGVDYSPPWRTGIPALSGRGSWFAAERTREDPECLTSAPQASPREPRATARPAARMFFAASRSRSCRAPQGEHVHCLVDRLSSASRCPHAEHVFELGYQRSTAITVRPYQSAVYSSCRRSSAQEASEIAGQGGVADHVADGQVLDDHRLVLADDPRGQFVEHVPAPVGDPGVHARHRQARLRARIWSSFPFRSLAVHPVTGCRPGRRPPRWPGSADPRPARPDRPARPGRFGRARTDR